MPLENAGRLLVIVGLVVVAAGLLFMLAGRVPFLGRLPGDLKLLCVKDGFAPRQLHAALPSETTRRTALRGRRADASP